MDLQLAGKKALITGASMGIGKAIALSLASEGCDVALCARDKSRLDLSADEIRGKTGRTVFTIAADLARAADADAFIRESHRVLGRIDILVNHDKALAFFVNGTMIDIDGGQQKPLMDQLRDR
jgi:3-oxoacyl-[acyl-carrier protein] reductase